MAFLVAIFTIIYVVDLDCINYLGRSVKKKFFFPILNFSY